MIIRRGDAESFARDLGARDCIFVPFPSFAARTEPSAGDGSVYAAGSAHRDWTCLIDASRGLDMNVLISTNDAVDIPAAVRSRVEVRPLSSPEVGRTNIDRAGTVCVPLHETELPSGPVVIVDAMAMGKVVVAADVNGSRDYIADGKTGYLYPAGDANALRDALRKATDPGSTEIAQAAQHFAASELDPMHVLATMIAHLDQARSAR